MAVVYVVAGRESSLVCGVPFGSSCVFHLIGFQSLSVVSAVTHPVAKLSSGCGGCNDLSSFWCKVDVRECVQTAIGGSDRSGLRRRDGVFGFYKWMVSHGVPSAASTYPDCYNLLLWSSSVLLMLYSKALPVWVLAAFSLGSLSLGMLFIRQLMY
ncbi:hypothetical protein Rs2_04296 [Raphanus sativus]|nr:hypothetical protein Rs2_04296 [Raphanus sativus]